MFLFSFSQPPTPGLMQNSKAFTSGFMSSDVACNAGASIEFITYNKPKPCISSFYRNCTGKLSVVLAIAGPACSISNLFVGRGKRQGQQNMGLLDASPRVPNVLSNILPNPKLSLPFPGFLPSIFPFKGLSKTERPSPNNRRPPTADRRPPIGPSGQATSA